MKKIKETLVVLYNKQIKIAVLRLVFVETGIIRKIDMVCNARYKTAIISILNDFKSNLISYTSFRVNLLYGLKNGLKIEYGTIDVAYYARNATKSMSGIKKELESEYKTVFERVKVL